jgi:hypothetical protein
MDVRKTLSYVHLSSTVWFMLCTGYVFILAMWQAGFNWLVIFSLSGHLALLVMLLVSLYLFSIFRSASNSSTMQNEHPLTSTTYYTAFYVSTPFLGAITGVLGMIGETRVSTLFAGVALGTIGATFLTWIVVDCVAGSAEMLTPRARKHRAQRLADIKLRKQQEQTHSEQLMAGILEEENKNIRLWQQTLAPQAVRLAKLLTSNEAASSSAEQEAIGIGVEAWRMGGLNCMRQLRNMAVDTFRKQHAQREFVDYISAWWDGIGRWRNPSTASG